MDGERFFFIEGKKEYLTTFNSVMKVHEVNKVLFSYKVLLQVNIHFNGREVDF